MKLKKTKQKDLETKKGLFFQIGLIASLLMVLLAFQYKSPTNRIPVLVNDIKTEPIPEMPVTVHEPPKPEPIPDNKQLVAVITDVIEIGDNNLPSIDFVVNPMQIDTSKYRMAVNTRVLVPEEEDPDEQRPIDRTTVKPTFKGQDANYFVRWVYSQIKYPEEAQSNNLEGTVYLSFVIGKDGRLSEIKNLRTSTDPLFVNEVMRVVKTSPNDWKPGKFGIRTVNVSYQMSIRFKLQ